MNFWFTFLAIIGMVIGSGFISGKEVVVFFSRFGFWSFPAIFATFFLFFFIFKFLLCKGEHAVGRLEKSRFSFVLNLLVCTIFSASMFAGTIDRAKNCGIGFVVVFLIILLLICAFVSKKGMFSLNKINLFLVPIMTIVLIFALISQICKGIKIESFPNEFGGVSILYTLLYVVLNTSNGCVLISSFGQKLNNKQKTRAAFLSALVLSLILLFINIVLLCRPEVFEEEMPLLQLFSGSFRQVLSFAIMIGCLTTLFSLIYSCSSSMRGLCKNEFLIFVLSVLMPFIFSLLGFGFIVSYLYPIASVLGVFLLADLMFVPLLKRADKKIHANSKNAK